MIDRIKIIQGDSVKKVLAIRITGGDKLNNHVIQKIYFSCAKLGITNKVIEPKIDSKGKVANGLYVLEFTSNETANFPPCVTNYDITIQLGAANDPRTIKTVNYQHPLEVLKKTNKVDY